MLFLNVLALICRETLLKRGDMNKAIRFQFTVSSMKAIEFLQQIPPLHRSLILESALTACFRNKPIKQKLDITNLHSCKKINKPIRYRISISDASLIQSLRRIPVRHRSLVVEMAIISWSDTEFGSQVIDMCCAKGNRKPTEIFYAKGDRASAVDVKTIAENRTDQETLQLMQTMLEFE